MKNILIVVDMQNDFLYGNFSNKNAQKIAKPIFQEIIANTVPYDTIIFTKDTHEKEEFFTINEKGGFEGRWFASHCINPASRDIVYPLNEVCSISNSIIQVVSKNVFDGSQRIMDILNEIFPTEEEGYHFYICGVCTDICVLATAIGLTKEKLAKRITVLTDLCAGTSPKAHKTAVAALQSFQIETTTIKQIKKYKKNYEKYHSKENKNDRI